MDKYKKYSYLKKYSTEQLNTLLYGSPYTEISRAIVEELKKRVNSEKVVGGLQLNVV